MAGASAQTHTTQLTPNSVAQVSFLGDSNGSSDVAFTCQNVYLWVT